MSILSIVLLVVFIAVFIWIKWDENRKWETVYESFGHQSKKVQERYSYLRKNGIECRMKNFTPGTVRMLGMQGAQTSTQSTILLQVNKKEIDRANKHLADFNKKNHQ
ncbi:MAG TPA: hypothetical protein VK142_00950 [Bacillota bacterium]|nr:hypothetical protein [Bacillota bacterium]